MMLKYFEGNVSLVKGAICVVLTIGSKTLPTTFFVISRKGAYNLLLGEIGFMSIAAFLLQCINALFIG